jgi:hypothetical protein
MHFATLLAPLGVLNLGTHPGPRFQIGYCGLHDEDGVRWVGWYAYGRWHNLPMRLTLRNHSPDGYGWGDGGSGPAQLALALLCHATRNPELALELYQQFKRQIVARLHRRRWHLTQRFIFKWIRRALDKEGKLCQLRGNGRVEVV